MIRTKSRLKPAVIMFSEPDVEPEEMTASLVEA
jgi:hypothetical protein